MTAHPGNGKGAFATGRYRNLFVERLGHTPAEVHAKVEAAFQQLFHGDGQEQRVYFETGANGGFILGRGYSAMDNIREFVDFVVPELQRRGLAKKKYAGPTLRENLNA